MTPSISSQWAAADYKLLMEGVGSTHCAHEGSRAQRGLRARHVAAIGLAMTFAGPFGVEDCVHTFDASWTCAGFFLTSAFYVLPQLFMTSELSMTLPLANGGVVAWIQRGLGNKAAVVGMLNMVVYQLIDLATYPALMAGYGDSLPGQTGTWVSKGLVLSVVLLGFVVNLLHVEVSSEVFTVLLVFIMLPFLVGFAISVPQWPNALHILLGQESATTEVTRTASGMADLNLFISTMMWLNSGWDSLGNLAEEVESPDSFVVGLLSAGILCPFIYLACTFAALAAGPGTWDDGYLAVAYGKLWAPLRPWIVCCAAIANFLLYTSELTCLTYLVQSLGVDIGSERIVPRRFGRLMGIRVHVLIALSAMEMVLVVLFNFQYLVQLSTLLHVVTFWLSMAAFAMSRFGRRTQCPGSTDGRQQHVRLWSVPGGNMGAGVIIALKVPVLTALSLTACSSSSVILGAVVSNVAFVGVPLVLSRLGVCQ